jgi:16S rRNA (guanine(527)-N(7))-methyltransferase RsmG
VFHVKQGPALEHSVPRETTERLTIYRDLLQLWNGRINLVSRGDLANVWHRHFLDSLQLCALMPPAVTRAIDLGSGAGFPGLVLAIATGVHFDLIEADHRKAAFLREAARATGAPATIHVTRIENAAVAPASLITARALAPLPNLLALAHPLMEIGAVALFPKGAGVDQELTGAAAAWNMRVERFPSQTDKAGVILRLSEVTSA